jgi:superoxide dismutase
MEKYNYICNYCSKEYLPRRRKVQKYCSNTCRVKAHFQKHKRAVVKEENNLPSKVSSSKNEKEKINLAGIGNAAIANVATEALKKLFTHEDQKPATKGDLKNLIAQSKTRYEKIENIPRRPDQTEAYFDNVNKELVYLRVTQQWQ